MTPNNSVGLNTGPTQQQLDAAARRLEEEKIRVDRLAAESAARTARENREKAKEEAEVVARQLAEKAAYLSSPMTEQEKAELADLEALANNGRSRMHDMDMVRLSDLRVKAANEKKARSKKDKD